MKFILYLTTNLKSSVNGLNKIYIGVHQTENPDIFDGYIGCGVYVNQPSTYMNPKTPFLYAVKKYGVKSFYRSTICIYDNKEEAYLKEKEIVSEDFIKQEHVYNICLGGIANNTGRPVYQFDTYGNLIKKWDFSSELYEYYGYDRKYFNYAIYDKHIFLNSIWSITDNVDPTLYIKSELSNPKVTYLYNKEGKLIKKFISLHECAKYLSIPINNISRTILCNSLVLGNFYISNKLYDVFVPKPRNSRINLTYYIYDNTGKYYGKFVGKEIMNVINLKSWGKIADIFRYNHGWYKDFFLSEVEIDKIPDKRFNKKNCISVDVFDKYGMFIETLPSIKNVREKYNIKSSDIKNIIKNDRRIGDYIFKYHKNIEE